MWAKRQKTPDDAWTSIVFPPAHVEVARVCHRTGEKPRLLTWDSYALEGSELAALKRLKKAGHVGQGRCATLLQRGQYQLLQAEAPAVPAEELREAVRWRIKESVDFPVDQAAIGVLNIPADPSGPGKTPQIFVVAASHAQLVPRIHLFQDAKLPLQAVDIPELAQRNVAALFEEENRGLALLSFDDAGGLLTFTYGGELLASRHIDVKRMELAGGQDAQTHYDRVLLEVQRSLDSFERVHGYAAVSRVLVAALPDGNAFIDFLKGNLYQPVEMLDLAAAIDLDAIPALFDPVRQAGALLSIGAALRSEAPVP